MEATLRGFAQPPPGETRDFDHIARLKNAPETHLPETTIFWKNSLRTRQFRLNEMR